MTDPTKQPTEKQMLQGLWVKAHREDRAVVLKMPSAREAARLRFALYNAVKGVRAGKEISPEIQAALESCSITIKDNVVTIAPRRVGVLFQAIEAALGGSLDNLPKVMTEEDAAIEASIAKVQQLLQDGPAAPVQRVTPYYTRES